MHRTATRLHQLHRPYASDHQQAAKCTNMHQLHQPDAPDHHLHQNPWQEFHLAKRTQGPLSTATQLPAPSCYSGYSLLLPATFTTLPALLSLLLPV